MSGNLAAGVDRDFLTTHWVNPNLASEKQEILIPEQEVEHVRVFKKEAPLSWDQDGIWREVELLLVDIGIGKIGVHGAQSNQIIAQPIFHIDTARMKGIPGFSRQAPSAQQSIRLHNEQASVLDPF